jgi:hypothetical protein|tara:strand:- start:96 stop:878 length:783 start_codon:yes stop_codon:yes gene_type:complete
MSVQKLRLLIVFVSIILVVSIPVSAEDSDGDGVSDAYDLCPQTPTGETVDSDGCSSSQKDTDGDGVSDANDAFPNDSGRSSDDLGSQVEYVFTGDAPITQYIGIALSACALILTVTLRLRGTAKEMSSDKQMRSLLNMIEISQTAAELAKVKSVVDAKFISKKISGEHHSFLTVKITDKNLDTSVESNNSSTVKHNVTKQVFYNIQDSVITDNGKISEIILPDTSSTGVMKDGFEWIEHEGNHYYRPVNQPNTQWQQWQG